MTREEAIKKLMEEDAQFREWRHHPMTHDLELEIEKLKKQKLYYKDLMEQKIQKLLKNQS